MRESVVLPAPDGEDRTSISPRRVTNLAFGFRDAARAISLFQVLHLLAELFDHALELKSDIGQRHVVRLGADRVGLAIELLREEIETAADGTTFCDQPLGVPDMRGEPVDLLADIGLAGDQDCL